MSCSINLLCPACHKKLSIEHTYEENGCLIYLCHCEECLNGIDSDWKVTYSTSDVPLVERFYWG